MYFILPVFLTLFNNTLPHMNLPYIVCTLLCRECATDVNTPVARYAIQAVGSIALRLSSRASICVDKLLALLQLDVDYIISETLVVMASELL